MNAKLRGKLNFVPKIYLRILATLKDVHGTKHPTFRFFVAHFRNFKWHEFRKRSSVTSRVLLIGVIIGVMGIDPILVS